MWQFKNGGRLIQSVDELPKFEIDGELFLDFETSSGDPKKKSVDPWRDCYVAGFGIAVNDSPAWYIPLSHHYGENLPTEPVADWLNEVIQSSRMWINHNVKYDMHVAANSLDIRKFPKVVDTLTLSKIIDSDRMTKGGYGLDILSLHWLHEDIREYQIAMRPYLEGSRNKDYGAVPADIMGAYCCQDVITNRRLWQYIYAQLPEQCERVWNNEIGLTSLLFNVEQTGMLIDDLELKKKEFELYCRMSLIDEKMESIAGRPFRAAVNEDCYDVLCNQYGLPVLAWTEEREDDDDEPAGNPSFDKHALRAYLSRPDSPRDLVRLMLEYRELNTLNNFFVRRYQERAVNGRMHPSYNQLVRTGRMSCKHPNAQQLNKDAKKLIHPSPGFVFIACDYSQIEFRLMMHYIRDRDAIAAYAENPDTDFHDWVAELCGINRKAAKNVNFAMGFGAGRKKVLKMLASNADLVEELITRVQDLPEVERVAAFSKLCEDRAREVFETYHARLPGLKRTSRVACQLAEERGFVFNLLGRRRHLPLTRAHIAFNTLNQGSAADIIKEQMLELVGYLSQWGARMIAQVHDELLMEVPESEVNDPRLRATVLDVLEHPRVELRVPLRCTWGFSGEHWHGASSTSKLGTYNLSDSMRTGRQIEAIKSDSDPHIREIIPL